MRTVEFAFYLMPMRPGQRKRAASAWRMSPEDAAARGLTEADKVPGSIEHRDLPETEEERARTQVHYQSAGMDGAQPPRK